MHTTKTRTRTATGRSLTLLGSVTLLASLTHCGGEWAAPDDGERTEATVVPVRGGAVRTGTFETPSGPQRLTYSVVDGRRYFEGDIELGPSIEERAATDRSALSAGRDTNARRWVDNTVVFENFDDLPPAVRDNINAAMRTWTATTSIRFRERNGEWDFVRFRSETDTCTSMVGRQGGGQTINVGPSCDAGAVAHEIGHAVGLWHEHTRPDRDGFVVVDTDCIESGEKHNFDIFSNGSMYGLYDFDSIMHYGQTFFYAADPPSECESTQYTMWRRASSAGTQERINPQSKQLSVIDRQGVEEMYSQGLGQSVAVGDFNADGYRDVALGMPRNGAGVVRVYRGTATGLVFVQELSQPFLANQNEDRFGYALVAADFTGDGRIDLAVGVPGEDNLRGRVMLYRGLSSATTPLEFVASVDQGSLSNNEAGDRFGYALSAGDVDNDGYVDLAVGAPGEAWGGAAPSSGAVYLYRGGSAGVTPWRLVGQSGLGLNEAGDSFGASVLLRDFDADGRSDLAVGAPTERDGNSVQAGVVFLFRGATSGVSPWRTFSPSGVYQTQDLLFGFSLAAGDSTGDGFRELMVGAPGASAGGMAMAGRVFAYLGSATGPSSVTWQTLNAPAPVGGEGFGFSLAAARFNDDVRADLVVGVPGGNPSTSVASGQVFTYSGATTGFSLPNILSQSTLGTDEAGDRLGASVAVGDIDNDGDDDLVAGAPGERPPASAQTGFGFVYRSNGSVPAAWTVAAP